MKKLIIFGIAVLSLLLVGCQSSNNLRGEAQKTKTKTKTKTADRAVAKRAIMKTKREKPLKIVNIEADMLFNYKSVSELAKNADLIVRGKITAVDYLDHNYYTYTKITLKIDKSFSPGAKKGDIITIIRPGGITTQAEIIRGTGFKFGEKIGPKEENTKVRVLFEGEPLPKVGDEGVYFLAQSNIPPLSNGRKHWDSIGAYQGRFNIVNGIAQRDAPDKYFKRLKMSVPALDAAIEKAPKKSLGSGK